MPPVAALVQHHGPAVPPNLAHRTTQRSRAPRACDEPIVDSNSDSTITDNLIANNYDVRSAVGLHPTSGPNLVSAPPRGATYSSTTSVHVTVIIHSTIGVALLLLVILALIYFLRVRARRAQNRTKVPGSDLTLNNISTPSHLSSNSHVERDVIIIEPQSTSDRAGHALPMPIGTPRVTSLTNKVHPREPLSPRPIPTFAVEPPPAVERGSIPFTSTWGPTHSSPVMVTRPVPTYRYPGVDYRERSAGSA